MKTVRPVEPRAISAIEEVQFELTQFGWPETARWVVQCLVRSTDSAETDNRVRVTELWNAYRVCPEVAGSLLFLLERLTVVRHSDDSRCFTQRELHDFLNACRQHGVDLAGAMSRCGKNLSDPARIATLLQRHDAGASN